MSKENTARKGGDDAPRGCVTIFESPDILAKVWSLGPDGTATKAAAAQFWRGTYRVQEFGEVRGLAALVDGITTNQALCASLPADGRGSGRVTTAKRQAEGLDAGATARTKENFGLQAGVPGVLYIDHDAEPGKGGLSQADLWQLLLSVCPALGGAGVVWKPSGSSYIVNDDTSASAREVTGLKGQHLYVMLKDAADGPRVVKVLADRLWLAGRGRVEVSKSGALLVRGVLDTAVSDNARLIFSGGAHCVEPLRQDRGPAVVLSDGGWLDSRRDVPDLTAKEAGEVRALIDQAKAAKAEEAGLARAGHTERQVSRRAPVIAAKEGIPLEEAGKRVRRAVDAGFAGELLADFELTVVHPDGRHEVVTVAEVLADREKYHEARCLCPLNPEHRGGSPDARLYLLSSSPCMFDLDDSGKVFRLRGQVVRLEFAKGQRGDVVRELVAVCRASGEVFIGNGGEPVTLVGSRARVLDIAGLMTFVDTRVSLFQRNKKGEPVAWDLNRDVAELVLGVLRGGEGVPRLQGVMTTPYPTPDGRIITRAGYDEKTGIFLALPEGSDIQVPNWGGTAQELKRALGVVFAPFSGYQFSDPASAGAAVAAVFTALCRPVLSIAPGVVVDASSQGSGKTKFMTALGVLVEGEMPGVSAWSSSEEERKKAMLAVARSGAGTVLWDNVLGVVRSASVSAVLTSGIVKERVLGSSEQVSGQVRALIAFSGNNASLDADLLRRVMQVRINAGDRPTSRAFEFCPVAQALDQRQQIAEAACLIWRAYFDDGAPVSVKGDAGGYRDWNTLVRQLVLWLVHRGLSGAVGFGELADPATSMLADHTEADGDSAVTAVLLRDLKHLADEKTGGSFTARDAHGWYTQGPAKSNGDAERSLWEALTEIHGGKTKALTSISLGRILLNRRDRMVGGLRLVGMKGADKTTVWRVV